MSKVNQVKKVARCAERIGELTQCDPRLIPLIEHMIESLTKGRDRVIAYQKKKLDAVRPIQAAEVLPTVKQINGILRDVINKQGPIHKCHIGMVANRVKGELLSKR